LEYPKIAPHQQVSIKKRLDHGGHQLRMGNTECNHVGPRIDGKALEWTHRSTGTEGYEHGTEARYVMEGRGKRVERARAQTEQSTVDPSAMYQRALRVRDGFRTARSARGMQDRGVFIGIGSEVEWVLGCIVGECPGRWLIDRRMHLDS
jgi:hypothetical protein